MGLIELPAPASVVPAEVAEAILRMARHEVAVLEVELAEAEHEASSLEAVVGRAEEVDLRNGVATDPRRDLEVERRLGDFLEAWRRSDEDELHAAIEAAKARAEMRIRLARVEAGAIVAAARDAAQGHDDPEPAPLPVSAPTPEPAPVPGPAPAPQPVPASAGVVPVEPLHTVEPLVALESLPIEAPRPTDWAAPGWFTQVLAALDRAEPADALAAVVALAADSATQPTGDVPSAGGLLMPGGSPDETPGESKPPVELARGDEGFARFWNYEEDVPATATGDGRGLRLSEWVPMWGVVPMLVVVVLVALASAWTG